MYLVSSNDLGETFGTAQRLGNQSWQLNGCPMDGGMLAVTPSGEVVTAWRRKGSIFTSSLKPSFETNVGNGEQPWVAADAKGTYLVWTGSREGDLMLTKLGASEPTRLASNARDPVVVATQSGSGLKHVFWEQRVGDNSTIMWQTTR